MIKKTLGIIGGAGKLGTALLTVVKKTRWRTINIDYDSTSLAKTNILVQKDVPMTEQIEEISNNVGKYEEEFDALMCFAGNPAGDAKISDSHFFDEYERNYKTNIESALLRKI